MTTLKQHTIIMKFLIWKTFFILIILSNFCGKDSKQRQKYLSEEDTKEIGVVVQHYVNDYLNQSSNLNDYYVEEGEFLDAPAYELTNDLTVYISTEFTIKSIQSHNEIEDAVRVVIVMKIEDIIEIDGITHPENKTSEAYILLRKENGKWRIFMPIGDLAFSKAGVVKWANFNFGDGDEWLNKIIIDNYSH